MAKQFLDETGLSQYETAQKQRYNTLNTAVGNKANNSDLTNLQNKVNSLETTVGNKANSSTVTALDTRVSALENNYTTLVNKIATKLESLI